MESNGNLAAFFLKNTRTKVAQKSESSISSEEMDLIKNKLQSLEEGHKNQKRLASYNSERNNISEINKEELEQNILSFLQDIIPPRKFVCYFKDGFAIKSITEEGIEFITPTNFLKKIIEKNFIGALTEMVRILTGRTLPIKLLLEKVELDFKNTYSPLKSLHKSVTRTELSKNALSLEGIKKQSVNDARFQINLIPSTEDLCNQIDSTVLTHIDLQNQGTHLNTNKTFASFIESSANNIAYASALTASKNPGINYPLLYIHSESGLGKTHLLHAIGNELRENSPHLRVCLISARNFMNELVEAVESKTMNNFRKKFSEKVDVLLIDDIQELRKKPGTQREFFHVFNELALQKKQLVFTADRSPAELEGIDEKILTRFNSGLVTCLTHPDFETRIAILKRKSLEEDIYLPDDVIEFIAQNVTSNIRELEGCLVRLGAFSSVMQLDVDLETAREQLNLNSHRYNKELSLTIDDIVRITSSHFKIPVVDIRSKVRKKHITLSRHVAMYLCHKHLKMTFSDIGHYFDNRDHSTVLHAVEKIQVDSSRDIELGYLISDIEKKF